MAVPIALAALIRLLDLALGQVLASGPFRHFSRRRSVTVRLISEFGATSRRFGFAMIFAPCPKVDWP